MASGRTAELSSTNMRAAGILVFCLFSSILSTVTSLRCLECVVLEDDCEPFDSYMVECEEEEDYCLSFVVNSTLTNIAVSLVVKECSGNHSRTAQGLLKHHQEGLFVTTTVGDRFGIARTKCCQSDLCNEKPLHLEPYDELKPNGLRCPGCYALNKDYCKANQVVFCVGKEDQCLTMTKTIKAFGNFTQKSSYKGCTTPNTCNIPLGVSELARGQIQFNITTLKCRKASSSEADLQLLLGRAKPSLQLLGNL